MHEYNMKKKYELASITTEFIKDPNRIIKYLGVIKSLIEEHKNSNTDCLFELGERLNIDKNILLDIEDIHKVHEKCLRKNRY